MPITDCQFNCTSLFWCHQTAMGSKVEKELHCEFWSGRQPGRRMEPLALSSVGSQDTGEQTAQPRGMYLYNNAESVACLTLMKQIAWENDQANAWQLSRYIRNPVLNTPLLKNAQVCVACCVCEQPLSSGRKCSQQWSKTTYIGSMEGKYYYFPALSVGEGAGSRRCFCQPQHALALQAASPVRDPPGNTSPFCHNPQTTHRTEPAASPQASPEPAGSAPFPTALSPGPEQLQTPPLTAAPHSPRSPHLVPQSFSEPALAAEFSPPASPRAQLKAQDTNGGLPRL